MRFTLSGTCGAVRRDLRARANAGLELIAVTLPDVVEVEGVGQRVVPGEDAVGNWRRLALERALPASLQEHSMAWSSSTTAKVCSAR